MPRSSRRSPDGSDRAPAPPKSDDQTSDDPSSLDIDLRELTPTGWGLAGAGLITTVAGIALQSALLNLSTDAAKILTAVWVLAGIGVVLVGSRLLALCGLPVRRPPDPAPGTDALSDTVTIRQAGRVLGLIGSAVLVGGAAIGFAIPAAQSGSTYFGVVAGLTAVGAFALFVRAARVNGAVSFEHDLIVSRLTGRRVYFWADLTDVIIDDEIPSGRCTVILSFGPNDDVRFDVTDREHDRVAEWLQRHLDINSGSGHRNH